MYPQRTRYNVFVSAVFLSVVVKKRYQHSAMLSFYDSFFGNAVFMQYMAYKAYRIFMRAKTDLLYCVACS